MPASKALGPVWATIVTRTWIDETSSGRTPSGGAVGTWVSIVLVAAPTGIYCVSAFATPARFAGSPFTETLIGSATIEVIVYPTGGVPTTSGFTGSDFVWALLNTGIL